MKTLDKVQSKRTKHRGEEALPYAPKTPLGRRLWALRQKYVAQGGKTLDWDQLEKEVALLKGHSDQG